MSYQGDGFQFKDDPVFVYDETDPRTYEAQWEAWQICRDTLTGDITHYAGSSGEQGGYAQRPPVASKPTAATLCRRLSRRGRDLL